MLCDISQVGVRYDSDSLYALVMISDKAKLVDHCPKTLPSGERRGLIEVPIVARGANDRGTGQHDAIPRLYVALAK